MFVVRNKMLSYTKVTIYKTRNCFFKVILGKKNIKRAINSFKYMFKKKEITHLRFFSK